MARESESERFRRIDADRERLREMVASGVDPDVAAVTMPTLEEIERAGRSEDDKHDKG